MSGIEDFLEHSDELFAFFLLWPAMASVEIVNQHQTVGLVEHQELHIRKVHLKRSELTSC
jgi:hypothetical protein